MRLRESQITGTRRRGRAATLLAVLAMVATAAAAPDAAAQDQPGTYTDVTEGVHRPAIDALAAKGLFEGTLCGDREFCPIEPIKRSTMSVWLIRALEDAEPPQPRDPRFVDVAAEHPWAGHIERLAQLGVTAGCARDPLRFCPQAPVTRAQMASFLARAFDFGAAEPAGFNDLDPGSTHNANINALAAAGITAGCARDPLRFCPRDPVTRAQMATFLARALDRGQGPSAGPQGPDDSPGDNGSRASTNLGQTPQQPAGDAPGDNGSPPDPDSDVGDPESAPPPPVQQPAEDAPGDNGDPLDDGERGSCVDGLCFIPLTEEEWREAHDEIFGD